jgi:hypothetical protein
MESPASEPGRTASSSSLWSRSIMRSCCYFCVPSCTPWWSNFSNASATEQESGAEKSRPRSTDCEQPSAGFGLLFHVTPNSPSKRLP